MSAARSMPVEIQTEHRGIVVRKIEVRKADQGKYLEGYAAVFFDPANPEQTQFRLWGNTFERIMPSAFTNALARPDDVRCLFNHDDCEIYGRTAAGTMTLSVDKVGLRFSCLLPDTDDAGELVTSIERGDISGCSFGFRADAVTWRDVNDQTFRELTDVSLYDVGPCTFPAYSGTSTEIAQRSLTAHREACQRTGKQSIDAIRRRLRLSRLAD